MVTPTEAGILQFIYEKYEEGVPVVSPVDIARERGISRPAALSHLKNINKKGMGNYLPGKGFVITEKGIRYARRIIRNHRILEYYFNNYLGISLEKSCKEAIKIQCYISANVVENISRLVGEPTCCPHGREIPRENLCSGGE